MNGWVAGCVLWLGFIGMAPAPAVRSSATGTGRWRGVAEASEATVAEAVGVGSIIDWLMGREVVWPLYGMFPMPGLMKVGWEIALHCASACVRAQFVVTLRPRGLRSS